MDTGFNLNHLTLPKVFNAMHRVSNGINYFAPGFIILLQCDVGPWLPSTFNCLISTNQSVFVCVCARARVHVCEGMSELGIVS